MIARPKSRWTLRPGWGRDVSGSTAIEFAVVIGPMLLMTLGIFDVGLQAWKQSALQNGIVHVERLVRTGAAATMPLSDLRGVLCRNRGNLGGGHCDDVGVDIRIIDGIAPVPTLAELRQSDTALLQPGTRGSIVLVRAYDVHRLILQFPFAGDGEAIIGAQALTWVEP
jgi:hypothetical protein